ncbi:LysR family transcriptional regulator [Streptomyces microflavus]|uniref:LysR family transcriptional regulator n=1 Tax=Streptomyces microflavus TaxID=1919 RepID=UPI0036684EC2
MVRRWWARRNHPAALTKGQTTASHSSTSDADPVDPRLPRTFSAVITHGSFCYAARELGYTQSVVSQQTASLEGELGVELACRRPLGPTEAGARLMVRVASILLRIDAARAVVRRVKGKTTGRPTVGFCPPAATAHALRIIGEVSRRAGAYELTVRTLPRQAVAGGVATANRTSAWPTASTCPRTPCARPGWPGCTAYRSAGSRWWWLCRPHHPLAHHTDLRPADLMDARWIDAPGVSPSWRTCPPWSGEAAPTPSAGGPAVRRPRRAYVHRPQDPLALGREQGCRPAELVVTQIPTHRPVIPHSGNRQLANGASRYALWKGSRQRVAL